MDIFEAEKVQEAILNNEPMSEIIKKWEEFTFGKILNLLKK